MKNRSKSWRRSTACLAIGLTLCGTSAAAQVPVGSLYIEVTGEAVTVRADSISIREVLEELAQQSGLKLVLLTVLDTPVTVSFERQPLPDAIKTILHRQNFALQYMREATDTDKPEYTRPNTLWVLPGTVAGAYNGAKEAVSLPMPADVITTAGVNLTDEDMSVRLQAVLTLADVEGEQAALALAPALVDTDAMIREEAAEALGGIGGPEALELLEYALMDPDRDVRETAIEAFAEIGGDEAARALAPALNDADDGLRIETVDALGEIGGAAAIALLQQARVDESPEVREVAAGYLGRLSRPGP